MDISVYKQEDFIAVADSIRTANGTTDKIDFPVGFMSSVQEMRNTFENRLEIEEYSNENVSQVVDYAFYEGSLQSIDLPNASTVGAYAFYDCNDMTSANLPCASLIGESAFESSGIESVDLPNVSTVEPYTFRNCVSLQSAHIPNASSVGTSAFYGCSSLADVDVSKAELLGQSAFRGCSKLEQIYLPLATTIDRSCFEQSGLTSIEAPEAEQIGNYAFLEVESLLSVNLPKAKTLNYGGGDSRTFKECHNLRTVNLPLVEELGGRAFDGCWSIQSIDLPELTGNVGAYAFARCSGLREIKVPKATYIPYYFATLNRMIEFSPLSATTLQGYCINQCNLLRKVITGANVIIKDRAINSCTNFNTFVILYEGGVCTLEGVNAFYGSRLASGDGSIYVPDALVEDYKVATNWSTFADEIKPLSEYKPCTAIAFNTEELTFTNGDTQTLNASVAPSDTTDDIVWEVLDSTVATVENGVVTPLKNGTTTIVARCGSYTANAVVTVSGIA